MKSIDWMPLFGDAFWESERVAVMSDSAVLLYQWLLWQQFKGGDLPGQEVLRMMPHRWRGKAFDKLWPQIAPCFETTGDGRLSNARCAEERVLALDRNRKAKERADAANKKRWPKRDDPSSIEQGSTKDPCSIPERSLRPDRNQTETRHRPAGDVARAREAEPSPSGEESPLRAAEALWERLWSETRLEAGKPAVWRWTPVERAKLRYALEHLAGGDLELLSAKVEGLLHRGDDWQTQNASPSVLASQWHKIAVEPPAALEPRVRGPQRVLTGEDAADAFLRACTPAEEVG